MSWCAHCGRSADDAADHSSCAERLVHEPPRYCTACGRRLVVQVTPLHWTATCSRHGTSAG